MEDSQLNELIEQGAVPPLYETVKGRVISISEFNELSEEEKVSMRENVVVVLDNYKWIACDRDLSQANDIPTSASFFSGDGEKVSKHIRRFKFGVYDVVDNALSSIDYRHLYTNIKSREEVKMEDFKDLSGINIDDLSNELQASEAEAKVAAPATPMTSFGEDGNPQEREVNQKIQDAISGSQVANVDKLQMFNRQHGRLYGYIVDKDSRIEFNTKQIVMKDANNRPQLLETTPENIRQEFEVSGKAPKSYYVSRYEIVPRETTPGKILAIVASIPLGGFYPLTKFREAGELLPDDSKKDAKQMVISQEMYPAFLDFYYGRGILEAKETHGELAGEIKQKTTARWKSINGNVSGKRLFSRRLVPEGRKSVLIPGNYLPIKTFESITLEGSLSQEEVDVLNVSSFRNLVYATPRQGTAQNKFELLVAEDANKVTRNEEGKIESRYFTRNASDRINLDIKPFWSKEAASLETIKIPVKEKKISKQGTERYVYVMYNTTDEEALNNPETRSKTSLYSGEFSTFLNATKEVVNESSLRQLTQRTVRARKTNALANEDLLRLQLGVASKLVDEEIVEFSEAPSGGFNEVSNKLYDLQLSVASND